MEISNLLAIIAMRSLNEEMAEKHFEKALSIGIEEVPVGLSVSIILHGFKRILLLRKYRQIALRS